ncbi:MAG TPA: tRNA (adenosine(37)-N6)-dimethylallyltransferase MiaA [Syntrophorhabdaceae bacterium]|jgi:tRNA dimethylallyltransferase
MLSNKTKILAVVGPTCTGKSALALTLAAQFDAEIINADSMQVYRHFTIGTAKPDTVVLGAIPHHLIDIAEAEEDFNAALFVEKADRAISEITARGKLPILVGGTGLYLRALTYGLFKAPSDTAIREELRDEYDRDPLGFYERLKEIDYAYAMRISFKDRVRAVRAMEVFRLTGSPMSELEKEHGFREARYDMLKIGLTGEREELYRRINGRVEEMLERGWVEEVKGLIAMGYDEAAKPFGSIGYREILLYIKGEIPYEVMVEDIKKHTRHYAKRQVTWFSKEKEVNWFSYPRQTRAIEEKIKEFLGSWS